MAWSLPDWGARFASSLLAGVPRLSLATTQAGWTGVWKIGEARVMDAELRAELLRRVEKDQAARQAGDWGEVKAADAENLAWLKQVIAEHGWPGRAVVGEDGAHSVWLLAQNAAASDPAFQRHCLDLLTAAVEAGEAARRDLAYLTDRVLLTGGKPQEYGTQVVVRGGRYEPRNLRDPDTVDERRAAIGLESLADYLARFGPAREDRATNAELRAELLRRMEKDQAARKARDLDAVRAADAENLAWLKQVIAAHGWPGSSLARTDGASAAWLLVQHADRDPAFQRQCLDLVTAAAAQGEASRTDLAYLTDRVLLAGGEPQEYGTQATVRDGRYAPVNLRDPGGVDQRRASVGLPPLAEYLHNMAQAYGPPPAGSEASSGDQRPR